MRHSEFIRNICLNEVCALEFCVFVGLVAFPALCAAGHRWSFKQEGDNVRLRCRHKTRTPTQPENSAADTTTSTTSKVQVCGRSTTCRTDNTFFSRSRVPLTKQLELCYQFAAGAPVGKAEYEADVSKHYAIDFFTWLRECIRHKVTNDQEFSDTKLGAANGSKEGLGNND